MAKKYKISCPANIELLKTYHSLIRIKRIKQNKVIERLLCIRPVRSLSGIVNVSVLTKPYSCPGECIYCPEEIGIPKSYLKEEPAVMRAILLKFDPYKQVQTRLRSLTITGHPIDKIELRTIGGTWSYYPRRYQNWFIKRCFQACNSFTKQRNAKCKVQSAKLKFKMQNLEELQKRNEKAKCRLIGITIETRPDYINVEEIRRLRELGITRVELGVQSIYNDVLKLNKRGHDIAATAQATKLLKDAGFKVSYQIMPNLPGSSFKKDIKMFEELFSDPRFQPDLLKIYPLALVKRTPLYKWYQRRKYKPYPKEKLIKLLVEAKLRIPYYCRIQRIIRDIPAKNVVIGGVKTSNLREVAQIEMRKKNLVCKCIRCREIRGEYDPKEKPELFRIDYDASDGKEIFLSFESKNKKRLYALLRLRIPSETPIPVLENTAIIREVHTYGQMIPINKKTLAPQHRGLGKKLIKEAEKIAKKEFGLKKIAAISGIGVRPYWRKLGYRLKDTYMVKQI